MSNEIKNTKGAIVKEINGIKYFKLQSPYPGDYTKNCGLLSNEIDENFFFLRSYDIDSIKLDEGRNLILTRVDGEELNVNIAEEIPYPTFTLNKEEGKIIITYPDGTVQELEGFLFEGYFEDDIKVATDYTIKGDGTRAKPLTISELEKTGTYAPAKFLVDLTNSENTMPDGNKLGKGTRIVTKEYFTPFGLLYDYNGVKKIKEELEVSLSKWRIPSRKDWADLLNAAEYCEEDRNHDTFEVNKGTGNWAGARAKSTKCWEDSQETEGGLPVKGIDNLPIRGRGKFHVIPVGFGALGYDENFDLEGIRLVSSYWSSTPTGSVHKSENPNMFTRLFSYNTRKVIQESSKPTSKLSLRLCRDFDYDSFDEYETILGNNVPCVLISNPELKYYKVWTSVNIGFSAPQYSGVSSEEWADLVSEEEIQIKEVYYVNEWNGIKWLKKQMNPGDSIVIIDYDGDPTTSGDTYHEWRVYEHEDGTSELIDTVKAFKEELEKEFDEINEKIDTLSASTEEIKNNLNTLSASTEEIKGNLEKEIQRATSAETNLQKEIDSIEVQVVEPSSGTVLKSYAVFVNNEKRGATIDIPKDEKIHDISTGWSGSVIDEQTGEYTYQPETGDTEVLRVIYRKDDGLYHLSEIAIEDLVHENEFKDGLLVKGDHTVNVYIDPDTEKDESGNTLLIATTPYFENGTWKGGLKLSGLNGPIKSLQEELDRTQEGAGLSGDGSYIQNTGATYISGVTNLNAADVKLDTELARVEKARKDITGQSGDTYVPNTSTTSRPLNYISEATNLNDADIKLDEGIQKLDNETVKGVVVDGISGTVNENVANVQISGTSIPIGEDYETHIIPSNPDSVPHPIHNSYSVLDAVKQLDINIMSGVTKQINDEVTRATNAEESISGAVTTLSNSTVSAISRIDSAITTEVNRASSREEALASAITTESGRATDAETYISGAVTSEISRAQSAETIIDTNLQTEVTARQNADANLNTNLQTEITRATSVENNLRESISGETQRATNVEGQLHLAIENEVDDRQNAISDEITNRENADARLERLITANTQAIETEKNRAISAENSISGAVTTLSSSTVSEISRIDTEIATLSGRTVSGKEAIKVIVSADSTSIVSLQLSSGEQVLEQDNNGLKTNISLEYNKNDEKIYLKGKDSSNLGEVSTSGFTGFKLSSVTPTEANVREAYQLINSEGVRCGDVVKIYKDSSLYYVYLGTMGDTIYGPTDPRIHHGSGDTALCFIYHKEDDTYELVAINVQEFLQESEFKDGLDVTNHEVRVKKDNTSENFLSISPDGVKISGIQTSIDSAVTIVNNTIRELSGSVSALTEKIETLEQALEEVIYSGITGTIYEKVKDMLESSANEISVEANDTTKKITISFNNPYIIGKHDGDNDDF